MNTPRVSIAFSNNNLLKQIANIDGAVGMMCTGTGTTEFPLNTPLAIISLEALEALGVSASVIEAADLIPAVVGVAPTATVTFPGVGTDGDVYSIAILSPMIPLGNYTKVIGDTTVAAMATAAVSSINANTVTHGCTAVASGGNIIVTAPVGALWNGRLLRLNDGSVVDSEVFAGGVTAVAEIPAVLAADNSKLHKEVKEFYTELGGNQEIYVMIVAKDITMTEMLDSTSVSMANKLIAFAEGKISKLGVFRTPDEGYDAGDDFFDADVLTALTAAKSFVQAQNAKLSFLRVLIEGRLADEDSATIFAPNTATNGFAGVVLGDTVSGTGAAIGLTLGRSAKYACHIKLGKVANGALSANAIFIGTKALKTVTNLDALHGKGVICFVTYPQKAGFFFGIDNMASTDDFKILVHGAVIDAAAKVTAAVYIDELEGEVDTNADGTITELDAKHLEDRVEQQAQVTLGDRITAIEALVDRTVNIINTSTTKVRIRVRPKGYNTFIEVDLGLTAGV